ncbi:MAG: succinylglutamate desuccinylase/aspartoacylase family protein [Flavobacteriaceae bacterium]|nr:succinylglutamate desuccinylase/aspartoacylase family protein [Flavobacteriaceae bacterium]
MTKVFSKALNKTIEISRIIGEIIGTQPGPTLIFTAGIHGNEPSGVFALHQVLKEIKEKNIPIKGNIYAISGNLTALENGSRFINQDLNRMWTSERMRQIKSGNIEKIGEDTVQQLNIYNVINNILTTEEGPFYFMDLHTTSSETIPFLTVNDSLINRKFTEQYPVPLILGIEEYLDGPLLSYINELGYVAFGFEGGQHDSLSSIENHIAFIYQSLVYTEAVSKEEIDFQYYYDLLAKTSVDSRNIYEIYYHYRIKEDEKFTMKPGFLNFQRIDKGQELADSNGETITAKKQGRILMPQYQCQGDDGYFSIRKIPQVFLNLSSFFRKLRFDKLLPIMPGVSWRSDKKDTLIVNRKIAWLFAKQFFHLMGYRSKKLDETHLIVKNREAASREDEYGTVLWLRN